MDIALASVGSHDDTQMRYDCIHSDIERNHHRRFVMSSKQLKFEYLIQIDEKYQISSKCCYSGIDTFGTFL